MRNCRDVNKKSNFLGLLWDYQSETHWLWTYQTVSQHKSLWCHCHFYNFYPHHLQHYHYQQFHSHYLTTWLNNSKIITFYRKYFIFQNWFLNLHFILFILCTFSMIDIKQVSNTISFHKIIVLLTLRSTWRSFYYSTF